MLSPKFSLICRQCIRSLRQFLHNLHKHRQRQFCLQRKAHIQQLQHLLNSLYKIQLQYRKLSLQCKQCIHWLRHLRYNQYTFQQQLGKFSLKCIQCIHSLRQFQDIPHKHYLRQFCLCRKGYKHCLRQFRHNQYTFQYLMGKFSLKCIQCMRSFKQFLHSLHKHHQRQFYLHRKAHIHWSKELCLHSYHKTSMLCRIFRLRCKQCKHCQRHLLYRQYKFQQHLGKFRFLSIQCTLRLRQFRDISHKHYLRQFHLWRKRCKYFLRQSRHNQYTFQQHLGKFSLRCIQCKRSL